MSPGRNRLGQIEQARRESENTAFHEWWKASGHADDPIFTLTMENCAHAAWQERAALSAGQAQPVAWAHEDFDKELSCYDQGTIFPNDRSGGGFRFIPLYASPPPAVPGEVHAQLALIKHLAEYTTEKNWDDKRLYIMQAVDRALSAPSASIEGETP